MSDGFAAAIDRRRVRTRLLLGAGAAILLMLGCASIALGSGTLTAAEALRILVTGGQGASGDVAIVRDLRLPRALMAIVAGAGLSLAGVGLQGITRNPLVSPYTLGISSAAGFGASLAMLLGLGVAGGAGAQWVVLGAMICASVCALLVLGFAALRQISPIMLILGGVGLNYLFEALTSNVQFLASDTQLVTVIHWTFGSLNGADWSEVLFAAPAVALTWVVLRSQAWALNAFAAGSDEETASLGFAVARSRIVITAASVLATAVIVSFSGKIGFIGLIAPHVARMLIGADHRVLLPFSAVVGAILLLTADMIGRLAFAPVIVPVGIVVAYLGVPIFLHLLLSRRQDFA